MKVTIAIAVCALIDDGPDTQPQAVSCRNPLDDLIERMRREAQYGRDSVKWRKPDGAKVSQ